MTELPVQLAPIRFAPDVRALLVVVLVAVGAFLPWSAVRVPAVLALVLLLPGWSVVRLLALPFERWERAVLAMVISGAISACVGYLTALITGYHTTLVGVALAGTSVVPCLFQRRAVTELPAVRTRLPRRLHVLLAVCALMGAMYAYYQHHVTPQTWPYKANDTGMYLTLIRECAATVPPLDVQVLPQEHRPLRYYYFAHLVWGMTVRLTHGALTIETAFLLMAIVARLLATYLIFMVARFLFSVRAAGIAVVAYTLVGGFDWLPDCALRSMQALAGNGIVTWRQWLLASDGWAPWYGSMAHALFARAAGGAHHQFAINIELALALLIFLPIGRVGWWYVVPLMLYAMIGSSMWTCVPIFPAIALFFVWQWRCGNRQLLYRALQAGAIMVVLALPYLNELAAPSGEAASGVRLGIVQSMRPEPGIVWDMAIAERVWGMTALTKLLDVPVHYFMEFGLLGIGALAWLYRRRRAHVPLSLPQQFWWWLAAGSFLSIVFVMDKSACNNVAFNGANQTQLALLFFAAAWAADMWPRGLRGWQWAVLSLALLLSLSQAAAEYVRMLTPATADADKLIMRDAAMAVNGRLPADAIVQGIPSYDGVYRNAHYYLRPGALHDLWGALQGSKSQRELEQLYRAIVTAFAMPDARQAHAIFAQLGVTHIIVGPHERKELAKFKQPLQGLEKFAQSDNFSLFFSNQHVRIYQVEH
ncbi:MAG: hypothetical protein NTV22_04840 [bacterium]|nr:hypothetical protein [bacterium]